MTHYIEISQIMLILISIVLINLRTKDYFNHRGKEIELSQDIAVLAGRVATAEDEAQSLKKSTEALSTKVNTLTVKAGLGSD